MDLGLKGLKAVVTGGSKGIGRHVAEIFADEGADVAICARNADEVQAAVAELGKAGVKAWGSAVDVADAAALKAWIEAAAATLGGIDVLVANVSALAVGNTPETWEASFRIDVMHTVHAVQAATPYLEKSSAAAIVIVSSVSGVQVDFTGGSYGAIKAALIHYSKALSNQLIGKGIRTNVVSPGNVYFDGGIWQQIEKGDPAFFASMLAANPTGRMATAQEIANGIVFLASPAASRISGTNLIIDGALSTAV